MTSTEQTERRLPITLLTGFLGSGKTTVLNRLLRDPRMTKTAVIVNEFGEVGIDHLLVAQSSDEIIELSNGCLCCAVRSDLVTTLFGLFAGRVDGTVAPFERVLVETTGLADPAPILFTLFTDEAVARRYRVDGVVTTVDAVNGEATLDRHAESVKQAAAADLLLLTKHDLAGAEQIERLRGRLMELNPGCPVRQVAHGEIDPAEMTNIGIDHLGNERVLHWLEATAQAATVESCPGTYGDGHRHDHGHHVSDHPHADHHSGVTTQSWVIEEAVAYENLVTWIRELRRLGSPNLLRVKGLLNVAGRPDGPLVVHAVQEVFHPPVFLDRWPSDDRRTRLVFILKDLDAAEIERTLPILMPASAKRPDLRKA